MTTMRVNSMFLRYFIQKRLIGSSRNTLKAGLAEDGLAPGVACGIIDLAHALNLGLEGLEILLLRIAPLDLAESVHTWESHVLEMLRL